MTLIFQLNVRDSSIAFMSFGIGNVLVSAGCDSGKVGVIAACSADIFISSSASKKRVLPFTVAIQGAVKAEKKTDGISTVSSYQALNLLQQIRGIDSASIADWGTTGACQGKSLKPF